MLLLEEFDYTIEYKLRRMHMQANHLSKLPNQIDEAQTDDTLIDKSLFIISTSFT